MTMPNITFCMSKKQVMSHFKIDANETLEEWDQVIQVRFHFIKIYSLHQDRILKSILFLTLI